jgi:hypothetical protein
MSETESERELEGEAGGDGGGGFEFEGRYYRMRCTDMGKDLMLIDRIAGMGFGEFFLAIEDPEQRRRGPVFLTLIATSLRAGNPDWSLEKIVRTVMSIRVMSDIDFVPDEDREEDTRDPLPEKPKPEPDDEHSSSPSNGSSSSPTPPESEASSTLSETR